MTDQVILIIIQMISGSFSKANHILIVPEAIQLGNLIKIRPQLFIARQHAIHGECDAVVANPSVRQSNAGI